MRKVLLIILLVLLIIGFGYIVLKGQTIGNLSIWGVKKIQEENDIIDQRIATLSKLSGLTYTNVISNLNTEANEMQDKKEQYENAIALATSDTNNYAIRTEKYPIEYLWTKLGNYAANEGIIITMYVLKSSSGANLYDLKFRLVSDYRGVTEFLYDIENDSSLGFKIDEFSMNKYHMQEDTENFEQEQMKDENLVELLNEMCVETTFTCKDINIDIDESMLAQIQNNDTNIQDITNNNTNETADNTNSTNNNTNQASDKTNNNVNTTNNKTNNTTNNTKNNTTSGTKNTNTAGTNTNSAT